ncbi:uncharacterized protein [Amphiura filiformis]|uniref:uncharacterized protein n=1 Tax=Amphiura filiformis TaxID=82378 RepID=UPI003B220C75
MFPKQSSSDQNWPARKADTCSTGSSEVVAPDDVVLSCQDDDTVAEVISCHGDFKIAGTSADGRGIRGTIKIIPRSKMFEMHPLLAEASAHHSRSTLTLQTASDSSFDNYLEYDPNDVDVQFIWFKVVADNSDDISSQFSSSLSLSVKYDTAYVLTNVGQRSSDVPGSVVKMLPKQSSSDMSWPSRKADTSKNEASDDVVPDDIGTLLSCGKDDTMDEVVSCHGDFEIAGMSADGRGIRGTMRITPRSKISESQPLLDAASAHPSDSILMKQTASESSLDAYSEYDQMGVDVQFTWFEVVADDIDDISCQSLSSASISTVKQDSACVLTAGPVNIGQRASETSGSLVKKFPKQSSSDTNWPSCVAGTSRHGSSDGAPDDIDTMLSCHGEFEIAGISADGRGIRGTMRITPRSKILKKQPLTVEASAHISSSTLVNQTASESSFDAYSEYDPNDVDVQFTWFKVVANDSDDILFQSPSSASISTEQDTAYVLTAGAANLVKGVSETSRSDVNKEVPVQQIDEVIPVLKESSTPLQDALPSLSAQINNR